MFYVKLISAKWSIQWSIFIVIFHVYVMHFYVCLYVCINIHMYAYLNNDSCLLHPLVALLKKVVEYNRHGAHKPPMGFLLPLLPLFWLLSMIDKQVLISVCLCPADYSSRGVRLAWIFLRAPQTFNGAQGNTWGSLHWCVVHFTNVLLVNTLRQWQNGRHFVNDIFKCIFLNRNVWIPIEISLKFNPGVQLTIFQHWFSQWLGNRCQSHCLNQWWLPSLPTHICFTRPLWVNKIVLRLTQPVFSICIYCILNRTCLLYAPILYGKQ